MWSCTIILPLFWAICCFWAMMWQERNTPSVWSACWWEWWSVWSSSIRTRETEPIEEPSWICSGNLILSQQEADGMWNWHWLYPAQCCLWIFWDFPEQCGQESPVCPYVCLLQRTVSQGLWAEECLMLWDVCCLLCCIWYFLNLCIRTSEWLEESELDIQPDIRGRLHLILLELYLLQQGSSECRQQ